MEILLIVAIAVVGAAALYVAATFNLRTRQNAAPLIQDAINAVSDQLRATEESVRRQLRALTDDLQRDREQQRLDARKIQGRLDHADSRVASLGNQFLADLDAIKRRAEAAGARQDQLGADLRQLDQLAARLAESLGQPAGPATDPQPLHPARPATDPQPLRPARPATGPGSAGPPPAAGRHAEPAQAPEPRPRDQAPRMAAAPVPPPRPGPGPR